MKYPAPLALVKFLKPYDSEIRKLALQLRALVLEEMAPCYENIYDAYSAVAIGYGTSERLSDGVFHIAVYSKHVNLGFNDGATLDDPKGILQGKGSRIRHITIKTPEDLGKPEIPLHSSRAKAGNGGRAKVGRACNEETKRPHFHGQGNLSKKAPAEIAS